MELSGEFEEEGSKLIPSPRGLRLPTHDSTPAKLSDRLGPENPVLLAEKEVRSRFEEADRVQVRREIHRHGHIVLRECFHRGRDASVVE